MTANDDTRPGAGQQAVHAPAQATDAFDEVGAAAPVIDLAAWRQRRAVTNGGAA